MLSARLIKKLEGIEKCSRQGHKVRNLFNIMTNNPELWLQAYANIYPNKGALAKGTDEVTVDGFCEDRVANMIKLLKEGKYWCKPSRRTYIRKANGKQRPLGIQSGDDKLVQEVARLLLERVYEPVFSETSHGFRTGRSCHTALDDIRKVWTGVRWLINVDVASYFDNIDHQIMVSLIEQRIDDQRFIKLIKSMLSAGYLEDCNSTGHTAVRHKDRGARPFSPTLICMNSTNSWKRSKRILIRAKSGETTLNTKPSADRFGN
jgi:retron-type reverse transcriptase